MDASWIWNFIVETQFVIYIVIYLFIHTARYAWETFSIRENGNFSFLFWVGHKLLVTHIVGRCPQLYMQRGFETRASKKEDILGGLSADFIGVWISVCFSHEVHKKSKNGAVPWPPPQKGQRKNNSTASQWKHTCDSSKTRTTHVVKMKEWRGLKVVWS